MPQADKVTTKKVPAKALRLSASPTIEAAKAGEGVTVSPVSMLARTGEPIENWYFGKLVHDMAGFTAPSGSTPIDYCHDAYQILGYSDAYEATPEGLKLAGQIVSTGDDRSEEVQKKSQAGVPYQASIYFDYSAIEQLSEGATAEVNGLTIEGPAAIVRQWSIFGCAICPYGNDSKTSVELSANVGGEVDVAFMEVAKLATENQPEAAPATPAAVVVPPVDPTQLARTEARAELKRYTERFGAKGAEYFSEGKDYTAALELHATELASQVTARDTEIADLKAKLSALPPRGEETPVSFSNGDAPNNAPTPKHLAALPAGLAKMASGIKFAGK